MIAQIFRQIRRLHAAGLTVVLVEQNTRKEMGIVTRAVVIRVGRVVYDEAAMPSQGALASLCLGRDLR